MKQLRLPFVISVMVLLLCSLSLATPTPASNPWQDIFRVSTDLACKQRSISICTLMQVSREQLPHNVAYYRALVKVGPGDYDVIAISRLVREWKPGFPVHTVGSFFFIHGSNATFNRTMVFHGNAMGTFLSDRNIDVWGIDLRNVQIPAHSRGRASLSASQSAE